LGKYWVIVQKIRDEKNSLYPSYIYEISFLTRDKEGVKQYLQALKGNYQKASDESKIRIFKYINNNWEYLEKPKIKFEDYLPEFKKRIIAAIENFINNEEEYHRKNLLRHIGILLHGLPGCGKSYFLIQLASHLNLNVYYMNPADFKNNNDFVKAVMEINFPAIMLLEDLDCIKSSHDREDESGQDNKKEKELITGVGLETLLNVFDGLLSQDNQIIIATTNHIDKLDDALTRAGRFHLKVEFGLLTSDEICKYLRTYYEVDDIPLYNFKPIEIAELVAICTTNTLEETLKLLPVE
jgi:chaperone BCS1